MTNPIGDETKVTQASEDVRNHLEQRTAEIRKEHQDRHACQCDRLFVVLMLLQWAGAIILAISVSPRTWIGDVSYVHVHVWAAIVLGGLVSLAPIAMAVFFPGTIATRHVIAVAQATWSALLIHLSGGRIETHFHVFGSLAFLAFYRDWKVLITASAVVATDHLVRGVMWPQSVYGVVIESSYRWIEHTLWVLFEDVFLIFSCVRSQREVREICQRRAVLELTNLEIEHRVRERTSQLEQAQSSLQQEFAKHLATQEERERLYVELATASRQAGMAEVATGVLHNVGNVLNSINVSANLIAERIESSRVGSLVKASQVIDEHRDDLGAFVSTDRRGMKFPDLLSELALHLSNERDSYRDELASLVKNIAHVKDIVTMQQSLTRGGGMVELLSLQELVEDSLGINDSALMRHQVKVIRQFEDLPEFMSDRHKVLQILINLISNAKYAVTKANQESKELKLTVRSEADFAVVEVTDNGIGIEPDHLGKVFKHGFTTKKDGHGFGLHSCALAAEDMGGTLSVHSDGAGHGARFTLRIPMTTKSDDSQLNHQTHQSITQGDVAADTGASSHPQKS